MYKIVEVAKTFIVRHSSQLTQYQPYVYCLEQQTADAVAKLFNDSSRAIVRYRWQVGAPKKEKPHWCVTPDVEWVLANANEVRAGQFYVGPWTREKDARGIWAAIVKGDDEVEDYIDGIGPCEEEGYVLVNAHAHVNPDEIQLFRHQLKAGDAFEYLHKPGQPYLVCDEPGYVKGIPNEWRVSTSVTARATKKWNAKVKRIPHWDAKQPVILPCVDPLERLGKMTRHGLDGFECLRRYEEAMRTENIGLMDGRQYVPAPPGALVGGALGGLSPEQVDLAKQAWTVKLSVLREQQRQADEEAARRNRPSCDDQDELPNMVYVQQ